MGTRRQTVRITLLVCLAMLQLQVYAAGTLMCQHADHAVPGSSGTLSAACPHTGAAQQAEVVDVSEVQGDCQKCVLDLCVLGGFGLPAQHLGLASVPPSLPIPGEQRHFYRFLPDPGLKPPIAISG